ncbi:unnamed protein product [Orchesella dallaii]|uniref:C2H2-type domain-containing protein n=1 Tax=Orchesella dallaii TaxID=48710 RepID=A0ABP1R726_9HEXA
MENCFCFVCLKTSVNSTTFTFSEESEDGNDKGLSVFWKFVKNYLRIKIVAPDCDCDEKKVKQRLCDDCAPLINSISQLYLELLGIQLRLSWKVGELANLLNRSVRESTITSESHRDAVLSMADQFGTGSGFDFDSVSRLAQVREELSAKCAKQAQEYLPDPPFVDSKIKMMMEGAESKDCSLWTSINEGGGGEYVSNEPNECYPCASDEEEEEEERISVPAPKSFCFVSKTKRDFHHKMNSTSVTDSEKGSKEKDPVFTQKMMGEMKLKPTNLEPIPSKKQEEIPHLKKQSCWWTCKLCGLTSAGKIHEHLQSHENALPRHKKPLHCLFCYRTFAYSQSLQHHVISWHSRFSKMLTKEGFLLCQEEGCIDGDVDHQVEFDSVSSLNQHLKTHLKNGEEALHLCSSCGLGFLDKNLLNLHKLLHIRPKTTSQGRRVACPVCGKKCNDSICLQNHYNIYHGAFLKTHKCSECSKVCASAKGTNQLIVTFVGNLLSDWMRGKNIE